MLRGVLGKLALIIALAGCATTPDSEYLQFVCTELKVDCATLPAPRVKTRGLNYLFPGSFSTAPPHHISVRSGEPVFIKVHEMAHYVAYWRIDKNITKCDTEHLARKVTASFNNELYTDEWRRSYGCTK